jgi:hypothetical protein
MFSVFDLILTEERKMRWETDELKEFGSELFVICKVEDRSTSSDCWSSTPHCINVIPLGSSVSNPKADRIELERIESEKHSYSNAWKLQWDWSG